MDYDKSSGARYSKEDLRRKVVDVVDIAVCKKVRRGEELKSLAHNSIQNREYHTTVRREVKECIWKNLLAKREILSIESRERNVEEEGEQDDTIKNSVCKMLIDEIQSEESQLVQDYSHTVLNELCRSIVEKSVRGGATVTSNKQHSLFSIKKRVNVNIDLHNL